MKIRSKILQWTAKAFFAGLITGVLVFVLCQTLVWWSAWGRQYVSPESTPQIAVGLVLGSSPMLTRNNPNPYFRARIMAAVRLYESGHVQHLLLSGDNRFENYNEPMAMKRALVALGIPESAITLDYAGLRTLDSVVRCRKIFGQTEVIIITQPLHNSRAIFLARANGLDAIGLDAAQPIGKYEGWFTFRESLARVRAVWDVVVKAQPRHLGKVEPIVI